MAIAKNRRSPQRLPFGFNPKVEHRNSRLRRSRYKPTLDQQNAAIAAAGHTPIIDQPKPAIHRELRKTLGEQQNS